MKYYESILDLVGNTPLVRLQKVAAGLKPTILAKLRASVGLPETELAKRLPAILLTDAGAAGKAMRTDGLVMLDGYDLASPVIRELTDGRLCASMAVPVHESGTVTGSLLVASYRPNRRFTDADAQQVSP